MRNAGHAGVIALLLAQGFLKPARADAALWNKAAFDAGTLEEALAQVAGQPLLESADIIIDAPDIAENGAVVPVGVETSLTDVESIAILCEKNPRPLAAIYEIPAGTLADIKTRVKMAGTSNVVVLVRAGGKYYAASKEIKVTRGGCGG